MASIPPGSQRNRNRSKKTTGFCRRFSGPHGVCRLLVHCHGRALRPYCHPVPALPAPPLNSSFLCLENL